jgi:hypothetical protein
MGLQTTDERAEFLPLSEGSSQPTVTEAGGHTEHILVAAVKTPILPAVLDLQNDLKTFQM